MEWWRRNEMAYDVLIDWTKVQRQKTLNSQLDLLNLNHRELTDLEVRAVVELTGRQTDRQTANAPIS